jgi:hypothetical protein
MKLPLLHPHVPEGTFDLPSLLEYEPPTAWHPEPGDVVDGTLIKIDTRRKFTRAAKTMFILVPPKAYDERDHLFVVVRASGVVLKNAVDFLKPAPGDRVAVRFNGFRPTADGQREYAHHVMAVRRNGRWVMSS